MKSIFTLLLLCLLLCGFSIHLTAQTSLEGKVTDGLSGETLTGATLVAFAKGIRKGAAVTDYNGNYSLSIPAGTYLLEVSYLGYATQKISGVVVKNGQLNRLQILMESDEYTLDPVIFVDYANPLIPPDGTKRGMLLTSEEIQYIPSRNIRNILAMSAGVAQEDENSDLSIKGSRLNATNFYIDDFLVNGNLLIPISEIEQMEVITGGIDAKYGDVTGGLVSIITKGPSGRLSGGAELETSSLLDDYNYTLAGFNISSPLIKKDSVQSILGLRLSGRYLSQLDDDPAAGKVFRIKEDKLRQLETQPVRRIGASRLPAAEFLSSEDVTSLSYRPFEKSEQIDFNARLDARLGKRIDLIGTVAYNRLNDQFTPNSESLSRPSWRLLNAHNNPTGLTNRYRANLRFKHRLGQQELDWVNAGKDQFQLQRIQNASYTLMMGYEKNKYNVSDHRHGNRPFEYGHVGNFDYEWVPVFLFEDGQFRHRDFRQQFNNYQPGQINPVLAAYNEDSDIQNLNDLVAFNGFFVGSVDAAWGFHTNVGTVYNRIGERDNDLFSFSASGAFEYVPKDSERGRHHLQFGITYEQRTHRGYELRPRELWNIARQQANRHILGVDTTRFADVSQGLHPTYFIQPADLRFYRAVRSVTGQQLGEYVNVDALRPDQLSLGMFSPQELTDHGIVNYWGYDFQGRRISDEVRFDDFFSATDEEGIRSFPVAADRPIYTAAYVQDKFSFKNVIFRLGLRVDRYDANTKVLKDPYSLYEIMDARTFYQQTGQQQPEGVQDHYKVYLDGEGEDQVAAFRDGEQWYFPGGAPANDGNVLFGGQVVRPRYVNPEANIKSANFDPHQSFEDYKAQLNWMPRLAFSFPISEAANFFAHYDILTQRPATNTRVTALDYYYFNERTPENNASLKPSKTIEYEIGFQQRLSNSSALKLAAYYREMRDMIQLRTYLYIPAPVNQYTTYGNLDFGTVKGFTAQYELRRTANVTLNANYTLQFASGTGSTAESQRGLTDRGNLRTLFPLDFDVRHRLVTNLDYRYGEGKQYNGPKWMGKDVFANTGINLQAITFSGAPFTAKNLPTKLGGAGTVGALNGSRLPWHFTLNLRINKRFNLSPGSTRPTLLNVYLRIQNVLDRRNIIQVYPASGSPTDDGYLASAFGQGELETLRRSGQSVESFLLSYQWRLNNPDFYSLPRRMVLGAALEF